jgi:hypothetical protein
MFTPVAAALCRLVAAARSGGAARLGAGFLQWIGDGEGKGAYLALSRCSGLPASHFVIPKRNPHIPVVVVVEMGTFLNKQSSHHVSSMHVLHHNLAELGVAVRGVGVIVIVWKVGGGGCVSDDQC